VLKHFLLFSMLKMVVLLNILRSIYFSGIFVE